MITQFEWQEEFNIGVDSIDQEHQRLFKIINRILAFKEQNENSQWACNEGIKYFKGHTMKHFADEEAYMESIGYEGLEQHRHIHNGFRENTLPSLAQELEQTGYAPDAVDHFLGVCAGWLIGHTLTEDLSITGKGVRKWGSRLPGDELSALKKAIVQLVFDMFHLEAHMISDSYSGERFGKGVYYRLVYGTDSDEKELEILQVFEEKLLINTVGKIMGIKTNKLDSMLIHATRFTSRQFVGRILEQFPSVEGYKLKEENLLSYEEFQRIFERETMQASLLFDTGEGYFSYCVIAPHLLEDGVGEPIEEELALEEVEKYLMKRETQEGDSSRKKVLIVDDSLTIRQRMKELLDPDYEVALAESGVAAIRTVTLNKPDLILLDYEMPVCNGRQTLQMLRSEKSFADIPVIFLTGRSDPETVQKILPLNPEGYLLKHLKPTDIKNKIDAFFEKKRV